MRFSRHTCIRGGAEVQLYRIEGGGHSWPMGRQYLPERFIGRVSQDLDASGVILDFFAGRLRIVSD